METMKETSFYIAYIQGLQKLYARLVSNLAHSRMGRYHRSAGSSLQLHANDIKVPLFECVDKIIERVKSEAKSTYPTAPAKMEGTVTPSRSHDASQNAGLYQVTTENVGDLSRYFKDRGNGSELHPGIKEKLVHSAWDHIYSAVRYANQANKSSATMHINIANSTCHELTHYMDEQQYQEFVAEIEKQLNMLLNTLPHRGVADSTDVKPLEKVVE